jgi:hypothetical protein
MTRWERGFCGELSDRSRSRAIILDDNTVPQLLQSCLVRDALHLYPVGARVLKLPVSQPVLHAPVVRQQQQSLTIAIKASHWIHGRHGNVVFESPSFGASGIPISELTQDVVGFVKQKVSIHHILSIRMRKGN